MVSPVPKHLRVIDEYSGIDRRLMEHVVNLDVRISDGIDVPGTKRHRAKFARGLSTALLSLAETDNVGDPMAGTGMLAWETGKSIALNDIDAELLSFLSPLQRFGCTVSCKPATEIVWRRDVCIFSPPYYPRTDRRKPNAHDDAKRGPVVGFRDAYSCDHPQFIGNPGGVHAILRYREQMTRVFAHLTHVCNRMIVVTKNWTRLGVELRLDLDTILMAQSVGWECAARHGWEPPPSLWARFNAARGGGVSIEDVLVFHKARGSFL